MSHSKNLSRCAWAGLGVGFLAAAASAEIQVLNSKALVQHAQNHFGSGAGSITLPTLTSEGLLVGAFLDEREGKRYMLDSKLTIFVPGGFGPYHRVAFGGIYGQLVEVPSGGASQDAKPEFAGYVEGLWRMEKNLTGEYEAFIYRRSNAGTAELAGSIRGEFGVAIIDESVHAPKQPTWVAQDLGGTDDKGPVAGEVIGGVAAASVQKAPVVGNIYARAGTLKAPVVSDTHSLAGTQKAPVVSDIFSRAGAKSAPVASDIFSRAGTKSAPVASDVHSRAGTQKAPVASLASSMNAPGKGPIFGLASGLKASVSKGALKGTARSVAGNPAGKPGSSSSTLAGQGALIQVPLMMGQFRAHFRVLD